MITRKQAMKKLDNAETSKEILQFLDNISSDVVSTGSAVADSETSKEVTVEEVS